MMNTQGEFLALDPPLDELKLGFNKFQAKGKHALAELDDPLDDLGISWQSHGCAGNARNGRHCQRLEDQHTPENSQPQVRKDR